jgi:predicted DNA-binding transcriptional regulator AlpA
MDKNSQTEELWRLPHVLQVVQVKRSHWWNLVRQGIAPAPLKISHRVSLWRSSDIQSFIQRLIDEAGGES